jgi:N-acetylmuramic acid 6-phosphate (MurNAc-6-P) etherase
MLRECKWREDDAYKILQDARDLTREETNANLQESGFYKDVKAAKVLLIKQWESTEFNG